MNIRLADTSNILNIVPLLENTGFFLFIDYFPVLEESAIPLEPNDYYWNQQWYFKQTRTSGQPNKDIDANKAWWITKGIKDSVRVYVFDSGVRLNASLALNHEDLSTTNVTIGINRSGVGTANNITDSTGHGTMMTGMIVARQNNTVGITGLSPSVEVVVDKLWNRVTGNMDPQILADAINNAVNYKISSGKGVVANLSFTIGNNNVTLISNAIANASNNNVILVCAAGNDNTTIPYPAKYCANYFNVLSIGATKNDDARAPYSNYSRTSNEDLLLMAPGGNNFPIPGNPSSSEYIRVLSNTAQNSYGLSSGTSIAAPMVTATVALMFSINKKLTAQKVYNRIIRGCEHPNGTSSWTFNFGYGRLNTFNSLVLSCDSILPFKIGDSNSTKSVNGFYRITENTIIPKRCTLNVSTGSVLILESGKSLNFRSFGKIILASGATFIQRKGSGVVDRGEFLFNSGSYYCVEDSAQFNLTGHGPEGPNDYGCVALSGGTMVMEDGMNLDVKDGAFLTVQEGGSIYLGDNCNLKFGGTSWLGLYENGAGVYFGSNARMTFSDSSWIRTDPDNDTAKIRFRGVTDTTRWAGIFLDSNTKYDRFKQCEFTGAQTSVTIRNSQATGIVKEIFEKTIFNVPSGGMGVYIENLYRCEMKQCTFNMQSTGTGLLYRNFISENTMTEAPLLPEQSIIKITGNTFNSGNLQAFLWSGTSNRIPVYVYGNNFLNSTGIGLGGRNIFGDYERNSFSSSSSHLATGLWQSNISYFANSINVQGNGINLVSAHANLGPYLNGSGQLVWNAGQNSITSTASSGAHDNIKFESSNAIVNRGGNSFTINSSNTQAYHLFGYLPDSLFTDTARYYAKGNCWFGNSSVPKNYLWSSTVNPLPVIWQSAVACDQPAYDNFQVVNMGDGVYDTNFISQNLYTEDSPDDDYLYYQALDATQNGAFSSAITNLKGLLSEYQNSEYIFSALADLHANYTYLDTSVDQNATNSLYNDLKVFLEDLMTDPVYEENFEFLDQAYNIVLACDVEMEKYEEALEGYEFITLYHPDAAIRMLASWDYSALESLVGSLGEGGGMSNKNSPEDKLDKSPIKEVVNKSYDIRLNKKNGEDKKEIEGNHNFNNSSIYEVDNNILSKRASSNLRSLSNLDEKQKQKRFIEDLNLLIGYSNETDNVIENTIPNNYELYQNYPNPFNPVTTIKYQIPKDGLVQIKIYDIIGREIMTLVNEQKNAGTYETVFNGFNFASGIYFYRIQAGEFIETKRMMLIK